MGNTASRNSAADAQHVALDIAEEHMRISVIIPVLNEVNNLAGSIESAQNNGDMQRSSEVIVVDGGSTDGSPELARKLGAKVLHSGRGRGCQMNMGWRAASGNWCMFLHADTLLPAGYSHMIAQAVQERRAQQARPVVWGAFQTIDVPELGTITSAALSTGVRLRTLYRHLPYGDQAIFVERATLERLGGYKEWPLLEDVELAERLGAEGPPAIVPLSLQTSGRRWLKLGFVKTMLVNQATLMRWRWGADVDSLAEWYRSF